MRYSKILTCAVVALVSVVLVSVQASNYGGGYNNNNNNNNNNYQARPHGSQYSGALNHYPGATTGCQGYNCNRQSNTAAARSPYGPYHSYAVRPVIYGGHGLYQYKGYARHPPAPRQRYPRSYGSVGQAAARYPSRGYGAPARHYNSGAQRNAAYRRPHGYGYGGQGQGRNGNGYGGHRSQPAYQLSLRPVKAVALVGNYNSAPARYAAPAHQSRHYSAGYGSGRDSTAYGSNQYAPAHNNNAYNQRYNNNNNNNHQGGYNRGNAY